MAISETLAGTGEIEQQFVSLDFKIPRWYSCRQYCPNDMATPLETRPKQPQVEGFQFSEPTRGKEIDLIGQVAIVTGSTSGIGEMIALKLALHGADVVINSRGGAESRARGEALAKFIQEKYGRRAVYIAGDVSIEEAEDPYTQKRVPSVAERIVTETRERLGEPTILVNNAGFTRDGFLYNMPTVNWDKVNDTIVKGAFLMTKAVAQRMMRKKAGKIVNIASIVAHVGNLGQANYTAAKAGLIGLTKASAVELGMFGINVNAIAPGWVETPLTSEYTEVQKKAFTDRAALKREITPEDIADGVVFLVSDRSNTTTGTTLDIDVGVIRR